MNEILAVKAPPNKKFLEVIDVACLSGYSTTQINRLINKGEIQVVRFGNRQKRMVTVDEYNRWQQARRARSA